MKIDVGSLTQTMVDAARAAVGARWPRVQDVAEAELRKLAQTVENVEIWLEKGDIDQQSARELVHMQQTAVRNVVCRVKGLGLLTARQVSEAATNAARGVVNRLVGFRLI